MILALVSACSNESGNAEKTEKNKTQQTREERIEEISAMEFKLKKKKDVTAEHVKPIAEQMIREYRDFVKVFPKDSLAPIYLFKAADLSVGVGKPESGINFIDGLLANYPDYEKNVEMMLFKGFIYEQHLNQHGNAVEAYQALIDRYPNHRLAEDARASIENLTLSEEELIKKFKAKNKIEDKPS